MYLSTRLVLLDLLLRGLFDLSLRLLTGERLLLRAGDLLAGLLLIGDLLLAGDLLEVLPIDLLNGLGLLLLLLRSLSLVLSLVLFFSSSLRWLSLNDLISLPMSSFLSSSMFSSSRFWSMLSFFFSAFTFSGSGSFFGGSLTIFTSSDELSLGLLSSSVYSSIKLASMFLESSIPATL